MPARLPPLSLLHGDDEFAIAEHLADLKRRLGPPENVALNTTEFDARFLKLAEMRAASDAMPFLAAQRLVVVNNMVGKGGAITNRQFIDDLLQYLPSLPPFTALVLVATGALPNNSRLLKGVRETPGGEVLKFAVPEGGELIQWILGRAAAGGGEFAVDGAQALAMAAGDDPRMLAQEIDKLLAYVKWSRPVRGEDVERLTPAASHANIFNLVDSLGRREGRRAIAELHRLLDQPGQEPLSIFAMIVRQFRLLLLAREMLDNGSRANEIASRLKLHPYVADKIAVQSRRYSLAQLEQVYSRLLALDLAMKSGADQVMTLDLLVAGLTN